MVKIIRTFVFSLLLISFLGAFLSFTHPMMSESMDGVMGGCTSMGVMMCPMDPLEHLAAWQGAFAATISDSIMLMFLLVLALVIAYSLRGAPHNLPRVSLFARLKRPIRRTFLRGPLAHAFARGILHSKAF